MANRNGVSGGYQVFPFPTERGLGDEPLRRPIVSRGSVAHVWFGQIDYAADDEREKERRDAEFSGRLFSHRRRHLSLFGLGRKCKLVQELMTYPEQVYVQMGFRRFHAHAQVIRNPKDLKRILTRFVLDSPREAHSMMGWDAARDDPETSDFSMMMDKVLIVRFDEC